MKIGGTAAVPGGNAYDPAITGPQDGGPAYFAFTVTPNAGTTMVLTDLKFKVTRESAVQALASAGLRVVSIKDVTPIAHNGCRPPKKRRV